eukprot:TCALIF_11629-PA protein Name:"Protein of unknown function" AED:0.23 eAED:0.25 QI:0/0/0/0.71/0.83/0.71/7/0/361
MILDRHIGTPLTMLAKLGLVTSLFWGLSVAQDYTDECPVDNGFFADAVQCDRYYECKNGEIIDHLCPDGLVYDESSVNFAKCSFQFSVDCSGRTELQPPTPSKLCPRLNGYFAHEDPNVCDKFYFCVDGVANLVSCPNTLIFDPTKGQCDFVDQVSRKGCSSAEVYKFACPKTSNSPHAHPRYPDPEDCQFFYLCIGGVSARRNGCTEGLVFNPDTVSCDRQSNVKGPCSTWYNETELARIKNPSSFPQSKISGNTPRERVNFRRKPVEIVPSSELLDPTSSDPVVQNYVRQHKLPLKMQDRGIGSGLESVVHPLPKDQPPLKKRTSLLPLPFPVMRPFSVSESKTSLYPHNLPMVVGVDV